MEFRVVGGRDNAVWPMKAVFSCRLLNQVENNKHWVLQRAYDTEEGHEECWKQPKVGGLIVDFRFENPISAENMEGDAVHICSEEQKGVLVGNTILVQFSIKNKRGTWLDEGTML